MLATEPALDIGDRRRRFLVSSFLDVSPFLFHFSRADDARPLDGDNGMCDDDGLLRSWTLLDDDDEEGPAGAGKHSHRTAAINAKIFLW